jgi:hypothetical protein
MTIGYYGRPRARHGENKRKVEFWLEEQPPGTEFRYNDMAEELGIPLPSANGILNTLIRSKEDSPVLKSTRSGWYIVAGKPEDEEEPAGRKVSLDVNGDDYEVMEVFGRTRDGSLLLRDADKNVWKAERI